MSAIVVSVFIHRNYKGELDSIDWLEMSTVGDSKIGITQMESFEKFADEFPGELVDGKDLGRAMVADLLISFESGERDWDIYCDRVVRIECEYEPGSFVQEIGYSYFTDNITDEIPF